MVHPTAGKARPGAGRGVSAELRRALWITAVYLVVGGLWIALSDQALLALVDDAARLSSLQTLKGWAFVGLSGLLVFALSLASLRATRREVRSEERLRTVLDAIPTRVSWKDPDGAYLGCNAPFAADMGLSSPAEIVGRTDLDLLPADQLERARAADAHVLRTGKPVAASRIPVVLDDDMPRWFDSFRIPVMGEAGEVEGVLFCYDDVTETVRYEIELRQAQKIQEVGQLTSGIVHDFKNVLAVILANTDLVDAGKLSPEEVGEAFADIRQAADSAHNVVRKLLGFSGKADLRPRPVVLGRILEDLAPLLSRLLRHAHDFRVEIQQGLPPVHCDPNAVEQMLLNLVTNARDAMTPGQGEIVVAVETVQVPGRVPGDTTPTAWWRPPGQPSVPEGEYVALAVSDEGTGIPQDLLPRAFEAFFTTKASDRGTGLGLAMVLGMMQQLGGFVEVRTELGAGTCVRLIFPPVPPSIPEEELPSDQERDAPKVIRGPVEAEAHDVHGPVATILVVEDQSDLRRTLVRVLKHSGYEVLQAGDGRGGLELARAERERLRLIISDLAMPEMGGMALFRALRAEGLDIPFVISSGQADLEEVARSREERGLPFIPKPWTVKELTDAVRRALDGKG